MYPASAIGGGCVLQRNLFFVVNMEQIHGNWLAGSPWQNALERREGISACFHNIIVKNRALPSIYWLPCFLAVTVDCCELPKQPRRFPRL